TIRRMPPSPSRGNRSRKPSSASGGDVAVYLVDSSALVKRYVQEVGTPWVRRLTHRGQATRSIWPASLPSGLQTGTQLELQPIMPLDLPVKVRSWELTVYPRSHI